MLKSLDGGPFITWLNEHKNTRLRKIFAKTLQDDYRLSPDIVQNDTYMYLTLPLPFHPVKCDKLSQYWNKASLEEEVHQLAMKHPWLKGNRIIQTKCRIE